MYNSQGKVKLTVLDEVNCKFEGLNPSLRREMINAVSFVVPSAMHTPAYKLGRWNGKIELMSMGGSTFIQMLNRLVPILDKHNIDIEIEDQRIKHNLVFEPIDKDIFSYVQFGKGHHMEGKTIVLHDHQVQAVNALLQSQQGTLVAATSSGKTIICAATVKSIEKYGRTITIVPSTDLVQQTFNDYDMVGLDTGVFYGEKKEFGHQHTVTTWQSLNCLWKKTKKGDIEMTEQDVHDFTSGVVAVIVDECLDGSTLIKTPKGSIEIKNLNAGDTVYSYNESTKLFEEDTIIKVHKNLKGSSEAKMLRIHMQDSSVLEISSNHKVLTSSGWKEAGELTEDDDILEYFNYKKDF